MIPALILNILEVDEEADQKSNHSNNHKRRREENSEGGTYFFGIVFIIAGIVFDIFFAYILLSYHKNGNDFDPRIPNTAQQLPRSK